VALTAVDRELLQNCLNRQPAAWNHFVDRFLSLIYHSIHFTAHLRSARLNPEDVEDIAAEILMQIIADDYKLLRQFRGHCSLATYLTVIARRICVHELNRRQQVRESIKRGDIKDLTNLPAESEAIEKGQEKLDQVEWLLRKLSGKEQEIVRQYYLEGRTYEEISTDLGVPVNSIGSVLSRARERLRELSQSSTMIPILEAEPPKAKKTKSRSAPPQKHSGRRTDGNT
jgi:RNA polymerase sigma-70 factor (ECF subfamily)